MKSKRQAEILRLVGSMEIETQEQMLENLKACGIRATQATISRDIKELHLVKQPTGSGAYKYVVSAAKPAHHNFAGRLRNIFKEGVTSFEMAQNIIVVKTMPGLASAACAALDGMGISGMLGSLAGDDTAILVMRTAQASETLCDEIHRMMR